MKTKTPDTVTPSVPDEDGMLPEYDFSGGVRGKYVGKTRPRPPKAAEPAPDAVPNGEKRLEMPGEDLLPEYELDYSKSKPNPYVGKIKPRPPKAAEPVPAPASDAPKPAD